MIAGRRSENPVAEAEIHRTGHACRGCRTSTGDTIPVTDVLPLGADIPPRACPPTDDAIDW